MKKTTLLIFSMLLILEAGGMAMASDASRMTLPSGMDNPMTIRYPELASAAAPASIGEGLRATYQIVTGSPESETIGDVEFVGGDGGLGLAQVTVVALEAGKAATWTTAFAPDMTLGAMKRVNSYGSVCPAGCGDFWCNPQVLQAIPERAGEDLTVTRGTFELGGKTYKVVRFNFLSNQGIALGMIYDLGQRHIALPHRRLQLKHGDGRRRPSHPGSEFDPEAGQSEAGEYSLEGWQRSHLGEAGSNSELPGQAFLLAAPDA